MVGGRFRELRKGSENLILPTNVFVTFCCNIQFKIIILIHFILIMRTIYCPTIYWMYLNDSQRTPVKPVEGRGMYDIPLGAKKRELAPSSIDAID